MFVFSCQRGERGERRSTPHGATPGSKLSASCRYLLMISLLCLPVYLSLSCVCLARPFRNSLFCEFNKTPGCYNLGWDDWVGVAEWFAAGGGAIHLKNKAVEIWRPDRCVCTTSLLTDLTVVILEIGHCKWSQRHSHLQWSVLKYTGAARHSRFFNL